jgi:hypothetical protein
MKRLIIIVSILCINPLKNLRAKEFDQDVIKHTDEYSYSVENSFVATIQGTLKTFLTKIKNFESKAQVVKVKFNVLGMQEEFKAAKYYLHADVTKIMKDYGVGPGGSKIYVTEYKYKLKPAKVVFYIAGLFDDAGSGNSKSVIEQYIDLGFHVVAIANPLSQEFLQSGPTYEVGNVKAEAKVVLSFMEQALKDLKNRKLILGNHVSIAGISHGGFIAAVAAALDSQKHKRLITRDVSVYSPPYNLLKAARYLDLASSETPEYFGLGFLKLAKKLIGILKIKDSDEISSEQATLAKGVVSNVVFKKSMVESLFVYDKVTHRLNIPSKKKDKEEWSKKLSFSGYYEKYAPLTFKQLKSGDAQITNWFDLYHKNTGKIVRVLTARDDFLNDQYDWNQLPSEQAIILNHGGHMGYVSSKAWFRKFMQLAHR